MRTVLLLALTAFGLRPGSLPAQRPAATEVVWPLPPESPRIRYVGSLSTERDVGRQLGFFAALKRTLLGSRLEVITLQRPHDVYVDDAHRMYVSDGVQNKVLVFDPAARRARILGGDGPGMLSKPLGLGGDGRLLYVADAAARRVVVFDSTGAFVRAYGGREVLLNPTDVAVDPERSRLYVVDSYLHQVVVFDRTSGNVLSRIGKTVGNLAAVPDMGRWGSGTTAKELRDLTENRGSGPAEFRYPAFVTLGPDGTVFVSDAMNFRVQVFDPAGRFLRQIGRVGDVPGTFARPKGVGVDGEGHLYAVDAAFSNIQVFDDEGRLLIVFGGIGRGDGQLWLPLGLHIDRANRVYIADRQNQRVVIYQYFPVMVTQKGEDAGLHR